MKFKRQPLVGLCPIGKFVFSHEDAMRYKAMVSDHLDIMNVCTVNIDGVIPDGMIRDQTHVEPVVRFFKDQQIDALFIPHCNFGTEGAAGMIARDCAVPTLLWGPRDEAPLPDGSRLRDSLCGTLATSKVLHTLKVPFTYISNCRIEDAQWTEGVNRFVRAAAVVKALRTMKIGVLGQRIDFFWSTIVDEATLLQRFGVNLQPFDMVHALDGIKQLRQERRAKYTRELDAHEEWITFEGYNDRDKILYHYAYRDWLLQTAKVNGLDALAVQSIASIQSELETSLCFGSALAAGEGLVVAPETDIHGAISSVLIEAATTGDKLSFLPDITARHSENDNAVLLWHVDAPLSLRDPNSPVKVGVPWILKDLPSGALHMRLKDGPLTLCRFDGSGDDYRLGAGQGHTVEGPYTQEFYTWMQVKDWPTWERQVIEGPYIHHCSCVYDHCANVLAEATRYIPGLVFESFGQPTHHIPKKQ